MSTGLKNRHMPNEPSNSDSRTQSLRNVDAKRRWELFHQAIAHAKRSNVSALQDEEPCVEPRQPTALAFHSTMNDQQVRR